MKECSNFLNSSILLLVSALRRMVVLIVEDVIMLCFCLPDHNNTSSVFILFFQTAELLVFITEMKALGIKLKFLKDHRDGSSAAPEKNLKCSKENEL